MKKILIVIVIVASAITVTAFSQKNDQKKAAFNQYWYELIANGDPDNYLDYQRVESQPCDGSSTNVCGVFAEQHSPSDIDHPDLTQITTTVYKP